MDRLRGAPRCLCIMPGHGGRRNRFWTAARRVVSSGHPAIHQMGRSLWSTVMRVMLVVVAACLLAAGGGQSEQVKKEMALLQGEWSMVSGEIDGKAMPEEFLKGAKRTAKGDETTVMIAGQVFMKATFTIDPAKKPKAID